MNVSIGQRYDEFGGLGLFFRRELGSLESIEIGWLGLLGYGFRVIGLGLYG